MRHLALVCFLVFFAQLAFGQQAKIIKVKGQQAIVQFPSGSKPHVGQTLNVGSDGDFGSGSSRGNAGAGRTYSLGLSTELKFTSNSQTNKSTMEFNLSGRFGWNLVDFELGPILRLGYSSSEGDSVSLFGFGGFFDYNLIPNVAGTEMIYGIGTEGAYRSSSSASSSLTSSVTSFFLGGFLKYFALGNSVALRGDAGFDYERRSLSGSSVVTSVSGFAIKGGLAVYF